jgi:hypothetical protein
LAFFGDDDARDDEDAESPNSPPRCVSENAASRERSRDEVGNPAAVRFLGPPLRRPASTNDTPTAVAASAHKPLRRILSLQAELEMSSPPRTKSGAASPRVLLLHELSTTPTLPICLREVFAGGCQRSMMPGFPIARLRARGVAVSGGDTILVYPVAGCLMSC